ncbi:MAG: DUF983 domain-containing protein [Chitinophagaceae bacterium]
MCAERIEKKQGLTVSILKNKCPRCRQGNMYTSQNPYQLNAFMKMPERCAVCGQPIDLEPGFYYGTSYVSYGLSILICMITFILWWLIIGFSFQDSRFFWWMGINGIALIMMQPLLMRISRTIWLSFFVSYNPDWKNEPVPVAERVNKDMANAW